MEFLSTPSARRATSRLPSTSKPRIFLSTPSARRATRRARAFRRPRGNFYPRPPRGGRPRARQLRLRICCISIHALREEGDGAAQLPTGAVRDFYPRPPRGGRLKIIMPEEEPHVISIHALREEGDSGMRSGALNRSNFYPRPPRGGRLVSLNIKAAPDLQFLSPPSARRATWIFLGDNRRQKYFYPRPPRGGRRYREKNILDNLVISIHALREEGDRSPATAQK